MKRSKFTDRQIMEALKQVGAGLAILEVCRELGISLLPSIHKGIPVCHYGGLNTAVWIPR
jgi:hypothetical protein